MNAFEKIQKIRRLKKETEKIFNENLKYPNIINSENYKHFKASHYQVSKDFKDKIVGIFVGFIFTAGLLLLLGFFSKLETEEIIGFLIYFFMAMIFPLGIFFSEEIGRYLTTKKNKQQLNINKDVNIKELLLDYEKVVLHNKPKLVRIKHDMNKLYKSLKNEDSLKELYQYRDELEKSEIDFMEKAFEELPEKTTQEKMAMQFNEINVIVND